MLGSYINQRYSALRLVMCRHQGIFIDYIRNAGSLYYTHALTAATVHFPHHVVPASFICQGDKTFAGDCNVKYIARGNAA